MKTLKEVLDQLDRIAKANKDHFEYDIALGNVFKTKIIYTFEAVETSDRHAFITVQAESMEELPELISSEMEEACEYWGYKFVN